jgi:replicative DNA helicase
MSIVLTEELRKHMDGISHVGAERALLGIAMHNPESLFDIATEIGAEDFTNHANKSIYHIMISILDNKYSNIGKVNPMIIHAIAQNTGMADDIGGMQYLDMLSKSDGGTENLLFFVEKVKQASIRKEAFKKAITVLDDAISCEEEKTDSFIARQEEKFLDMVMSVENNTNQVVRIGDLIDAVLEKRELTPKEILGVPTGFKEYDIATGGLVPGRLKVVASPPKVGKSMHAINIAMHIAINVGIPVLYIDTEMQTEEQIDRMLSVLATQSGTVVPESVITKGMYTRNALMQSAVDDYAKPMLQNAPLHHVYLPDFTPEKIHNLCRKFQRQHGIEWNGFENQFVLIFDYIKMDEDNFSKGGKEYEVLGQTTNMLKNKIAGGMNVPVLSYAQINPRVGYDNAEINSTHMSGSNRIVMFVNELSFLRRKTDKELNEDGPDMGNRVWTMGESRNGGSYKGWLNVTTAKGVPHMYELRNIALE